MNSDSNVFAFANRLAESNVRKAEKSILGNFATARSKISIDANSTAGPGDYNVERDLIGK
jgi:hypothetical protein